MNNKTLLPLISRNKNDTVKKEYECNICKRIIFDYENYCSLSEYNNRKHINTKSYHVICFRERFMNFKKIETQGLDILKNAEIVLSRIQGDGRA